MLREAPDWQASARELVHGLARRPDIEARIRLLDRLCARLGGSLYPAFLQLLCVIERNGDTVSRAVTVDTLLHALASGRLPVGHMPAWGTTRPNDDTTLERRRALGPLEFLFAWYAQPSELPPLDQVAFMSMATHLLRLIGGHAAARETYRALLESETTNAASGTLSRETRAMLAPLVEHWRDDGEVEPLVNTCLEALRHAGEHRLAQIESNPFF